MHGPRQGDRISEYVLHEKIGAGTFGEVWKATHHVWRDECVAVKIPTDPQYVRNLQHEGATMHGLRHPNIVRALGTDPFATPPYLVMEYVDGESLRQRIDRQPLRPREAIRTFRQIVEALQFAHENGVVHRDVKPANVLIARDGPVKLTDFGLGCAQGITTRSIMQSGSLLTGKGRDISGTLAYMAPEQQEGDQVDARADLYSAGIVLFEMLTGSRPAGGELPSQIRPDTPKWIDDLFARCYTRLERRFATAAQVLGVVERGLGGKTAPASPAGWGRRTPDGCCPGCGQENDAESQYCIHCGQQLTSAPVRCHQCGFYPKPGDMFCPDCGAELSRRETL